MLHQCVSFGDQEEAHIAYTWESLCFQPSSGYWPWVTLRTDLDDEVSGQVCGLHIPSRTLNQCSLQHYWQEICQGSFSSLHGEDFHAYPQQTPGFLWWRWQGWWGPGQHCPLDTAQIQQVYGFFFLLIFLCEICIRRVSIAVKRGWMLETQRNKINQTISSAHSVCTRSPITIKSLTTNWCHSETSLPNCTHWWDLRTLEWTRSWISQPNKTIHCLQTLASPSQVSEFAHQQCNKEPLHWQKQTKFQVETLSSSYYPTTH